MKYKYVIVKVGIDMLTSRIKSINTRNGWRDEKVSKGELIALIHSEASELLEFTIQPSLSSDHIDTSGEDEELADIIIRSLDYADRYGIDISKAIELKLDYNETRGYKHGGKII